MNLIQLDQVALKRCCGSMAWVNGMLARQPFEDKDALIVAADEVWNGLMPADWLEAFAAHPKIGEKMTSNWSATEQRGMDDAGANTAAAMAELNSQYQHKFGWIFIVCATGKSADEMLTIVRERIDNDPQTELHIAAAEQAQITKLRLEKLLAGKSGISTHVLDTAAGAPAVGIPVRLYLQDKQVGAGITNQDGRCPALLDSSKLETGTYRLFFEVAAAFPAAFFPVIEISFRVDDPAAPYHVPLLLSPFGYTTYRGS